MTKFKFKFIVNRCWNWLVQNFVVDCLQVTWLNCMMVHIVRCAVISLITHTTVRRSHCTMCCDQSYNSHNCKTITLSDVLWSVNSSVVNSHNCKINHIVRCALIYLTSHSAVTEISLSDVLWSILQLIRVIRLANWLLVLCLLLMGNRFCR